MATHFEWIRFDLVYNRIHCVGKAEGQDRLKDIKERLEGIVRDRNAVAASRKNRTKQSFANNVFDVMIKSTQGQVRRAPTSLFCINLVL